MDVSRTDTHTSDLLLIGGGHSHLAVIKQLGMRPIPGLRVTMISKDIHTPYSGMLPGLIAGHYQHDDAHIDLRKLCQQAGVRLFQSEVTAIDPDRRTVTCHNRPDLRYDWLSINTGSQPAIKDIPGAENTGIPVKPINGFLKYWQQILHTCTTHSAPHSVPNPTPRHIAIVGGGAASVEVALACQFRLQQLNPVAADQCQFTLICGSPQILPTHNAKVQDLMGRLLASRGIDVKAGHTVTGVIEKDGVKQLSLSNSSTLTANEVIWAIHAGSPQWPASSGLACDESGFIRVNQHLQSLSHPNIFAAGDICHFDSQPFAKSGVYAVRAGKHLATNLRRAVCSKSLKAYRPQQRFLSLLMTGDKQAVASKGDFSLIGKWLWLWKDHIDRRFMRQYQVAPKRNNSRQVTPPTGTSVDSTARCGGCGAKIGNSILSKVMSQLTTTDNPDVVIGLNAPDDAAVINPPKGKQWLQTVDYFRAFIDDPYLLGRIATNHCLSDIFAMGATPHSALAIATVPYANETIVENTLLQLMQGSVDSLNQHNTCLIGGHSSEGAELGFGLSVNGVIEPEQSLTKGTIAEGERLILTKPLGTGTLLAANMQGQAQGRWIKEAIQQMLISNSNAAGILQQHQASACTDITGFGLLGHLLEMLKAARQQGHNASAILQLNTLPLLNGAVECAKNGWLSSLHPDNVRVEKNLSNKDYNQHPHYPLLFDPQTAGGLLATVPANNADRCLEQLQLSDCPQAAIIGKITYRPETANVTLCIDKAITAA